VESTQKQNVVVEHARAGSAIKQNPLVAKKMQKEALLLAKQLRRDLKVEVLTGEKYGENIECISTGYQALDDVICGKLNDAGVFTKGAGKGFPKGRMIEIYGAEGSAKTSLALALIANAQKQGGVCAFIDAEHALDLGYARKYIGVDTDSLILTQPDSGDDGINTLMWCVKKGVSVVVFDSVSAIVTQQEIEGKKPMGEQARMMSDACRKITRMLKPGGPIVIFINQTRQKIGIVFGNPETTSGGNALKFYASIRIRMAKKKDLTKAGAVHGEPIIIGHRIQARIIKNKTSPCGGRATFDVLFGRGIKMFTKKQKKLVVHEDDSETQV
jgi:protein RecA